MLNHIWAFMIIVSIICSILTGNISEVGKAVMDGASDGAALILGMLGTMCFWSGIMAVGEKGGIIKGLSVLLAPIVRLLFPRLSKDEPARGAIVMNMAANLLGMGNAATPLGLRAMHLLDEKNRGKSRASGEMCMFVLINTASIQLIPTTIMLLRQNAGSQAPGEIIFPVWLVSIIALLVATLTAKLYEKRELL